MKKASLVLFAVMAALGNSAYAGTIHGKVSGVSGESVVYVEAVAGKIGIARLDDRIMHTGQNAALLLILSITMTVRMMPP